MSRLTTNTSETESTEQLPLRFDYCWWDLLARLQPLLINLCYFVFLRCGLACASLEGCGCGQMGMHWKRRGICPLVHLRGTTVGPCQNMAKRSGSSGIAQKSEISSATQFSINNITTTCQMCGQIYIIAFYMWLLIYFPLLMSSNSVIFTHLHKMVTTLWILFSFKCDKSVT